MSNQKDILLETEHGCFFSDGERRADYALVISQTSKTLTNYIASLEKLGLEFEVIEKPELGKTFLIIHIPQMELEDFSKIYDVGLEDQLIYTVKRSKWLQWLDPNLPPHVSFKKRGVFISKERILIINKLLERARFGMEEDERGLSKLLKQHVIEDAYPLHDGPVSQSSDTERQNDRWLLYLHWARFGCWNKEVPIDLVYKYFGCEIAFYFAWVEFFTLMLLPASVIGLLIFIVNFVHFYLGDKNEIAEVCDTHGMYICPTCSFPKYCTFKKLSQFCFSAQGNFLFDNYLTVAFAVFMSFWATIFLNLWKRKQNHLKMKWGVEYVDSDEAEIRYEYLDELKKRKLKKTSRDLEPFLPKYITFTRLVATTSVCMFLILLVLLAVLGVTVYKMIVQAEATIGKVQFFKTRAKTVATVTGSILQVIFIKIFGMMYGDLSICLTKFENPRTKRDFDNSILYKRYFLAFVNNYAALFYIAFLKGRFYRLPYRNDILRILETDSCQPTNCILALCIQLAFLMVLKKFVGNVFTIIILHFKSRSRKRKGEKQNNLSIYEEDYTLLPTNRYLLTTEFCEMIIEFGFVTFFVAAFPLAPLCAFLNNLMEHRLDAMKLVSKYRRPIPRKMSGIGAWDGVLQGVTYLSTATNALVIAFTSDFVWREVYRERYNFHLKGFVNSTLSAFATKDYDLFKNIKPKQEICYYSNKRYPPDHPLKYELTTEYWVDMAFRLICVFVFEHVILVLNGILSYAIPDVPKTVKEHMNLNRLLAKEAKLKVLSKEGRKGDRKNQPTDISDWIMV